jgi:DNA-binding PadR family transcriptional regulator
MPRTKMHILDTELGTHVFLTVLKHGKTTPYEIAKKIGYVDRYELKNGTVKEVVRPQKLYSIIKELEKENVVISKKDREGRIRRTVEVNWSGLVDFINQYLTEKLN